MTAAAQDVDPAERVVRVAHHDLLLLPPLVECAPVQHHVVLESCVAGSESRTVEGSCRDEYGQRLPGARVCRERGAGSEHAGPPARSCTGRSAPDVMLVGASRPRNHSLERSEGRLGGSGQQERDGLADCRAGIGQSSPR